MTFGWIHSFSHWLEWKVIIMRFRVGRVGIKIVLPRWLLR